MRGQGVVLAMAVLAHTSMASEQECAAPQIQVCVSKALLLPSKSNGKPWDFGGRKSDPKALKDLITTAMAGGAAAVVTTPLFEAALGAMAGPDPYVKVYVDNKRIIHTNVARDGLQAQWSPEVVPKQCFENGRKRGGGCNNCATIQASSARSLISIEVWESDRRDDDSVGKKQLPRIPLKALDAKVWTIEPFDQVLGLEMSLTRRCDRERKAKVQIPPVLRLRRK